MKGERSRPKWPSVEEQLLADKVIRNSALEKLIMENQDFDLLQSEEADDGEGLPLWLRVYWRKNHPDVQHPTVNPGTGYPEVLYDIYEWMLAHQDLPSTQQSIPSKYSKNDVERDGTGT